MTDDTREPKDEDRTDRPDDGPVISVDDWFVGRREVWLELAGVRYRLRLTRRNRLILQK